MKRRYTEALCFRLDGSGYYCDIDMGASNLPVIFIHMLIFCERDAKEFYRRAHEV